MTTTLFARLTPTWQAAFSAGIGAYLTSDAAPIGAVLTNSAGEFLGVSANDAETRPQAHAEIRLLSKLSRATYDAGTSLYTTPEPCPMCVGAIRLARLHRVHYAARDPAAGSVHLLGASHFMRDLRCKLLGPGDEVMEAVTVALVTESRHRRRQSRWRAQWLAYHRRGSRSRHRTRRAWRPRRLGPQISHRGGKL